MKTKTLLVNSTVQLLAANTPNDMSVGDIMLIVEDQKSQFTNCHLLRTFTTFVLLEAPGVTWNANLNGRFKGIILEPGDSITLEIPRPEDEDGPEDGALLKAPNREQLFIERLLNLDGAVANVTNIEYSQRLLRDFKDVADIGSIKYRTLNGEWIVHSLSVDADSETSRPIKGFVTGVGVVRFDEWGSPNSNPDYQLKIYTSIKSKGERHG